MGGALEKGGTLEKGVLQMGGALEKRGALEKGEHLKRESRASKGQITEMADGKEVKINMFKASFKNEHESIKNKINLKEDHNCMTHEEEVKSHSSTFVE